MTRPGRVVSVCFYTSVNFGVGGLLTYFLPLLASACGRARARDYANASNDCVRGGDGGADRELS